MLLCRQPLGARRREHDDLLFITALAEAEDIHSIVMRSDFDETIIGSVPLIHDFDDVDPTLAGSSTRGGCLANESVGPAVGSAHFNSGDIQRQPQIKSTTIQKRARKSPQ